MVLCIIVVGIGVGVDRAVVADVDTYDVCDGVVGYSGVDGGVGICDIVVVVGIAIFVDVVYDVVVVAGHTCCCCCYD